MRTLVVPDAHGRYKLVRGLLMQEGILDEEGARTGLAVTTVQLGDLANCVGEDRLGDAQLLRVSRAWFDVQLVGNHEHPYFGGPGFYGFDWLSEIDRLVMNRTWMAAHAVGETLLTHAGVSPLLRLPSALSVGEVALLINAAWEDDPRHPWFSMIGDARGGRAECGGILWRDDTEEWIDVSSFNQVYGHTVVKTGPVLTVLESGRWSLNLDCGGHGNVTRIAAVWLGEQGDVEKIVEFNL